MGGNRMKSKKLGVMLLAIVLLFGTVLAGCGSSSTSSSDDVIKIGFLGAKTGGHAIFGLGTLQGMNMAVEEINAAGGVLGK